MSMELRVESEEQEKGKNVYTSCPALLAHLRRLDVRLWADGDRLRYSAPKGVLTPDLRAQLADHKAEVLTLLRKGSVDTFPICLDLQRVPRDRELPLSFAQERTWFFDQLEPGNPAYNIPMATRIMGKLDVAVLEQSFNKIIQRHEILRTSCANIDGRSFQAIAPSLTSTVPVMDLREIPEFEREAEAFRLATEEAHRPFNLGQCPLLRLTLLQLDIEEYMLLLIAHHFISDGWSMMVVMREIMTLYEALLKGMPSPLPELPIQYADFAVWQRQWLQGEMLESQLTYWKEQLDAAPPVLELPTDHPRPLLETFSGACQSFMLPKFLTESLKDLSRQEKVTLFMTLLAAFKTLLYRYTGQEDIVVGSPIANRNMAEIENLIGHFVNTLVLRTDVSDNPTFRELLKRVCEVCLGAYAHQDLPFEKLVEELQSERNLSYSPLFQVMFNFQNIPRSVVELPDLTMTPLEVVDNGTAMFDLTLYMAEEEQGLQGVFEYNTDLFDASTITRMARHFQTLLEAIVADPEQPISELSLLTEAERHQLLVEWNDTQSDYPQGKCIHQLFEAQVEQTPNAVAVVFEDQQLTYQELNARANQLAHHLQKLGIGPEVLVGICMERSLEMIVGLLGILKAGGAYVPLDPSYPRERLTLMLEDAEVSVLLTQEQLATELPSHEAQVVCLDSDWSMIAEKSDDNLINGATAENLAYVIYTSGSTGKPKGVQIEHQALVNFLCSMRRVPRLISDDVLLAVTTLSFDIAALELFLPLMVGARLVIVSHEVASDGRQLAEQLTANRMTVMQATPATWRMLVESGWRGSKKLKILCGGEALPRELANQLKERSACVWNLYGPTETTIWSTVAKVEDDEGTVTLGSPIGNTQVYILDSHLQPVPIGVAGELHIGGDGLSRGYLNRPELTAERFIPNTFSDDLDARLYKTGDLVRYLPDGSIEFLGRMDHQVKIRGFRIELGEIEVSLSQHPAVGQVVVIAREDTPDSKYLVAYMVPGQEQVPTVSELRSFLKEKLPDYMVPSAFVMLDALPLTPNGKIDRRALPTPDTARPGLEGTFIEPRDGLELQLTKIWEKILNVRPVGVRDNFFDLGGHSLIAVRLFTQIQKVFGSDLPLATLFQAPTVEQLANVLRQKGWSPSWSSLVPIRSSGSKPPFFCIHGCGAIVLNYNDLARHLGLERPFYALRAQGLDRKQVTHTRIEDMAADYIKEIQMIQAEGPYFLGGGGGGGMVAFEIAQQLVAQDQEVGLLALMDTLPPPRSGPSDVNSSSPRKSLSYYFRRLIYHLWNRQLVSTLKGASTNIALRHWRIFYIFIPSHMRRIRRAMDAFTRAALSYMPQVYPGRITCFLREEFSNFPQARIGSWYELAGGGLDIRVVPGDHDSMWVEPDVLILAEQLESALDKAQADDSDANDLQNVSEYSHSFPETY